MELISVCDFEYDGSCESLTGDRDVLYTQLRQSLCWTGSC